jgi:hypothetical protein
MSSISDGTTTTSFISLGGGQPQGNGLMLAEISRPGVDGRAFREEQTRSQPFSLEGHRDVDNLAACKTLYDTMVTAYQGKVVTVVDDYGATHTNLACLAVIRVDARKLITAVGGVSASKGAYLVVRFELVRAT